ncbi:histidine phosphatase family protein [Streptococcus sp. DD12]|uniref:histidine phosphatase family protein n=1 Tax=Streptococcus sp. DD12 TaxID=1777880 RepID=UPI0007937205|nr:histidine phosphatase family protein [Streptococcus sp. DD12]KXT76605.1 hypothetical protein STRDD12_00485 [Streptococcus sp. DD12]
MGKTIYLMRHGQTLFNLQKRIQGWCDAPLTDLGIAQAQAAGRYFHSRQITFDAVYSSTQERACDTAEIVSGRMDYVRLKGLKEMNFGSFEGHSERLNPPLNLQDGSGYGDYFVAYGGESNVQVSKRMAETLTTIAEQMAEDSQVLVVTHGAALSQFYRFWTVEPPVIKGMPNCAILTIHVLADGQFRVDSVYDPVAETFLFER